MDKGDALKQRVSKTVWFSKAARKAHIADAERCEAIRQVRIS